MEGTAHMNIYVAPDRSEVYAYDDEQVSNGVLPSDLVPCTLRPSKHHTWANGWVLLDATLSRLEKWAEIKAERDRRKSGGVKVGEKWFHTDPDSRIQQLGLVAFGVSVPPVQWKTLDGSFIEMTQTLANQILQGVASLDAALFTNAEVHKATLSASVDPTTYDYSGGWPLAYGE
jgi:hypothetical protein